MAVRESEQVLPNGFRSNKAANNPPFILRQCSEPVLSVSKERTAVTLNSLNLLRFVIIPIGVLIGV